jgi:hypothetical protein
LQLTVHNVWVKGWPWNTTVIMRWSAVQALPDHQQLQLISKGLLLTTAASTLNAFRCRGRHV